MTLLIIYDMRKMKRSMIVAIIAAPMVVAPDVCAASPLIASTTIDKPELYARDLMEDKPATAMAGDELVK